VDSGWDAANMSALVKADIFGHGVFARMIRRGGSQRSVRIRIARAPRPADEYSGT
jgi:hypothetical protein